MPRLRRQGPPDRDRSSWSWCEPLPAAPWGYQIPRNGLSQTTRAPAESWESPPRQDPLGWLGLLVIPGFSPSGGRCRTVEREGSLAARERPLAGEDLAGLLDRMTELMLDESLGEPGAEWPVRAVAQVVDAAGVPSAGWRAERPPAQVPPRVGADHQRQAILGLKGGAGPRRARPRRANLGHRADPQRGRPRQGHPHRGLPRPGRPRRGQPREEAPSLQPGRPSAWPRPSRGRPQRYRWRRGLNLTRGQIDSAKKRVNSSRRRDCQRISSRRSSSAGIAGDVKQAIRRDQRGRDGPGRPQRAIEPKAGPQPPVRIPATAFELPCVVRGGSRSASSSTLEQRTRSARRPELAADDDPRVPTTRAPWTVSFHVADLHHLPAFAQRHADGHVTSVT